MYVFGLYSFGNSLTSLRILSEIVSGLPEDGKQDMVNIFFKVNNVIIVIVINYIIIM